MEIEEGEFYRTKKGEIRKAEDLDGYSFLIDKFYFQIVKHSKNIIDLVEVGDYVNGSEVVTVYGYDEDGNDRDDKGIIEVDDDYAYGVYLEDINIFSVVTKEAFAQAEYKIEKGE